MGVNLARPFTGPPRPPQVRNIDASSPANDIDFVECHMTVWE